VVGVTNRSPVPKRFAFVCAMPMEVIPLQRKLSLEKTKIGSLEVYAGSLGERPVVAIVTGIGGVLAAQGVERLVEAMDIEEVVVVGITGAIDNETPIGALVLPAVVVHGLQPAPSTDPSNSAGSIREARCGHPTNSSRTTMSSNVCGPTA
jgi:hypothetical protein